jgi:hypothetical protein
MSENEDTSHYEGALLEEINDRLKGIQEGQDAFVDVPTRLTNIEDDMKTVKADISTIKKVVTEHSQAINGFNA